MTYDVDLFVIGGGSGGVRAARMAAAAGARVALAEASRMGGTCVIRGCVPKKLMVFASSFRESLAQARAYGWDVEEGRFAWRPFQKQLQDELERLESVYRRLLITSGVTIHDGRATLAAPNRVRLADGTEVSATNILLATGGRPVRPDKTNAHLGMISDDIFDLEELPRSILVVGGGYIACEFACILNGLGVEVTQFYRGAQILRGFDDESRGLLAEAMKASGIDLHLGTDILAMHDLHPSVIKDHSAMGLGLASDAAILVNPAPEELPRNPGEWRRVRIEATNGGSREFDAVLFATGRDPNSRELGLEHLGVEVGPRGEILVDNYSQTSIPSIYAIGDVTNRIALTPVAIREGMAFVETVFRGNPTPVDYNLVPSAVFTQPELGTVGLSEEEAREREPVEIYSTSFRPMRSAFVGFPDRGLMKLIVSKHTRRVLGCHIVAPEAGEMIQLYQRALIRTDAPSLACRWR